MKNKRTIASRHNNKKIILGLFTDEMLINVRGTDLVYKLLSQLNKDLEKQIHLAINAFSISFTTKLYRQTLKHKRYSKTTKYGQKIQLNVNR